MLNLTIAIIGKIASGKSSIASSLQKATGIPQVSFGSYLVHYSKEHDLPIDRHALQDLGAQFIKQSPEAFLAAVIEHAQVGSGSIIIEGIRHLSILEAVKVMSQNVLTVFIDATSETRYKRYYERSKESDATESYSDFLQKNQHPVEHQIDLLRSGCNLVIDSENLSINEAVKQIELALQLRCYNI
jgi:cytidylate kinase